MRLSSFLLKSFGGLDHIEVSNLSDVVVLAGPNGVGKTTVLRRLIDFFRGPSADPNFRLKIDATSEPEAKAWGTKALDTGIAADSDKLRTVLQRSQRRGKYRSTVLNFDSDRAIIQLSRLASHGIGLIPLKRT